MWTHTKTSSRKTSQVCQRVRPVPTEPRSQYCNSPDGSERLVILISIRAGTLDEEELFLRGGQLVLLVHAVTAVAVGVTVVHLHGRLRVQTGTGWLCGETNSRSVFSSMTSA